MVSVSLAIVTHFRWKCSMFPICSSLRFEGTYTVVGWERMKGCTTTDKLCVCFYYEHTLYFCVLYTNHFKPHWYLRPHVLWERERFSRNTIYPYFPLIVSFSAEICQSIHHSGTLHTLTNSLKSDAVLIHMQSIWLSLMFRSSQSLAIRCPEFYASSNGVSPVNLMPVRALVPSTGYYSAMVITLIHRPTRHWSGLQG